MVSSMTGYSRCETNSKDCTVIIEIRSLNNRYLDIYIKLPRRFSEFENEFKNTVRDELSRGKIDVSITLANLEESDQNITFNKSLALKYIEVFKSIEDTFDVPITVKPEDLLKIDDLFEFSTSSEQNERIRIQIQRSLKTALKDLKRHRREEGNNLASDLKKRLNFIENSVKNIKKIFKTRHKEDFQKIKSRIAKIVDAFETIDPQRMEIEAAFIAEKSDISEECVRIDSHLKMFRNSLKHNESTGRRLDFILQEINREANTISAKSSNVDISQAVVRIKEEIDRLKEQVRNIE